MTSSRRCGQACEPSAGSSYRTLNVIADSGVRTTRLSIHLDTAGTNCARNARLRTRPVSKPAEVARMFRYIIDTPVRTDRRRAYVVPISIVTHLVVVATLIAMPRCSRRASCRCRATTLMAFINRDVVDASAAAGRAGGSRDTRGTAEHGHRQSVRRADRVTERHRARSPLAMRRAG